jgi:hypothetical protein
MATFKKERNGRLINLGVKADVVLDRHSIVAIDSNNRAILADDLANIKCMGLAQKAVEATGHVDNALNINVIRQGVFGFELGAGAGAITMQNVDDPVYVKGTGIALVGDVTNNVAIGRLVDISEGVYWVELNL